MAAGRAGLHSPETALAAGELLERLQELLAAEVRPQDRSGVIFRIRRLPDQVVAQPPLATGSYDQVRVRKPGRVQVSPDGRLVYLIGRDAVGEHAPHSVHDL